MLQIFGKVNNRIIKFKGVSPGLILGLAPGVLLMMLGALALIAPTFLIAIIAAFFIFAGAIFCMVAWKLVQFKRKLEELARPLQGRIIIHGAPGRSQIFDPEELSNAGSGNDSKKIILH